MKLAKTLLKASTITALCLATSGCLFDDDSSGSTEALSSAENQSSVATTSSVAQSVVTGTSSIAESSSMMTLSSVATSIISEPVLSGTISTDIELDATVVYELSGFVYVADGASITIPAGTMIKSEGVSALIIQQGGKIFAQGTEASPIVFTSKKATPVSGDWAGIVIHGKAPVSLAGATEKDNEALADSFGGTDAADNSGVLRYVRIEYAGYAVAEGKELNGLTLGGVGSGTVIDYVQVYEGKDDGIEWFGGTVNGSHLIVNNYHDDGFDIDEGYNGTNQYLLNIQGIDSDEGIEAGDQAPNAAHITSPVFEYVTIVANGTDGGAIYLKENSALDLRKAVIITTDSTDYALKVKQIDEVGFNTVMTDVFVYGNPTEVVNCSDATAKTALEESITTVTSPLVDASGVTSQPAAVAAGAGNLTNWWGAWSHNVTLPEMAALGSVVTEPVLTGTITTAITLVASVEYELSGFVYVADGASITIPAGTEIKSEGVSALIIQQGGKIFAEGTEANPIIFTSKKATPVSGDWAGIVIHGKAPVSLAGATEKDNEALADSFGGTDATDNSGVLRYVRIEYAGYAVAEGKELNGLTLGGVGSGTVIDYVQVYEGKDDGIEWFGGTVNGSHLIVNNYHDDGFDIDEGYNGTNQYLLNIQGTDSDEGIEAGDQAPNAAHITSPIFENITIIANGTDGGAIYLKDNSALDLRKALIITTDSTDYALKVKQIDEVGFNTVMTDVFVYGNPTEVVNCSDATAKTFLETAITTSETELIDVNGVTSLAAAVTAGAGAAPVSTWWSWATHIQF